jgi:hypothetical protein
MKSIGWGTRFFLFFLLAGAILYGRTLQYDFVYDDEWRIVHNPAICSLASPSRFFLDPTTQASAPGLQFDSHRPLVTLSFAMDYAIWGLRPAGWRMENIVFHAANATLTALLSILILGVSWPAALLSGLLFLVHPVQTESVVWVVERTNVMGLFFLLTALWCWEKKKPVWSAITLFLSLMTREIGVSFPLIVFAIDVAPTPRVGTLTMRSKLARSFG